MPDKLNPIAEAERISALRRWSAADPHNKKLVQIVDEAIATGKTEADVKPLLLVAIRDSGSDPGCWTDATINAKAKKIVDELRGSGPDGGFVSESRIIFRG